MILTAKDMHNSPAQAYREADKGETVIINHDRYPDKVFELTARDRKPFGDTLSALVEIEKSLPAFYRPFRTNENGDLVWQKINKALDDNK